MACQCTLQFVYLALFLVLFTSSATAADNNTGVEPAQGTTQKTLYNAEPVICYECNSHPSVDGKACYDPIDTEKLNKTECRSGICLKYVQNIENDIEQINRGCADTLEPVLVQKDKTVGCVLSTGTKLIQLQICNCDSDYCNGVGDVKATSSMIAAASALTYLMARLLV